MERNKRVSSRYSHTIHLSMVILTIVRQVMEKRFHGIDLHKRYATIIVRNSEGNEIQHILRCADFKGYSDSAFLDILMYSDTLVMEKLRGLITSSRSTIPGCTGFLFITFMVLILVAFSDNPYNRQLPRFPPCPFHARLFFCFSLTTIA